LNQALPDDRMIIDRKTFRVLVSDMSSTPGHIPIQRALTADNGPTAIAGKLHRD
jgi:hypothetical protein